MLSCIAGLWWHSAVCTGTEAAQSQALILPAANLQKGSNDAELAFALAPGRIDARRPRLAVGCWGPRTTKTTPTTAEDKSHGQTFAPVPRRDCSKMVRSTITAQRISAYPGRSRVACGDRTAGRSGYRASYDIAS